MKKILTILSSLCFVTTASASVVSCGYSDNTNNVPIQTDWHSFANSELTWRYNSTISMNQINEDNFNDWHIDKNNPKLDEYISNINTINSKLTDGEFYSSFKSFKEALFPNMSGQTEDIAAVNAILNSIPVEENSLEYVDFDLIQYKYSIQDVKEIPDTYKDLYTQDYTNQITNNKAKPEPNELFLKYFKVTVAQGTPNISDYFYNTFPSLIKNHLKFWQSVKKVMDDYAKQNPLTGPLKILYNAEIVQVINDNISYCTDLLNKANIGY